MNFDYGLISLVNYDYSTQEIQFQSSYVCLESHWVQVLVDFFPSINKYFKELFGLSEESSDDGCGGQ